MKMGASGPQENQASVLIDYPVFLYSSLTHLSEFPHVRGCSRFKTFLDSRQRGGANRELAWQLRPNRLRLLR